MRKIIFTIIVAFFSLITEAQYLAAFTDHEDKFWVFEAGEFNKVEYLEVQDYDVGGILVAYKDNGSTLKVYRNGEVESLLTGDPVKFKATDYLLGYWMYDQLHVYDNGQSEMLSTQAGGHVIQDSLIGWYNKINQTIQVYYNGIIYTIEDGLLYNPMKTFAVGDNTVAYVHQSSKQFKLFYRGKVIVLDDYAENIAYKAGRDIVAYIDLPDQSFNVFYKGEFFELETFKPKSFKVGDEILVYVDNLGKLKYFAEGETVTLANYEPQFYEVTDNIMIFEEQGWLKTFCNGRVEIIERYIPQPYAIDFSTLVYLDESRFVKAFQNCNPIAISYKKVAEIDVIRDLIIFVEGIDKVNIYFNGQVYTH